MSDASGHFTPGFASRIRADDHLLRRVFSGAEGFAPAAVDHIGRRHESDTLHPRHFAPADPNVNPTEGWDPFEAPQNTGFSDPIAAARQAGYAEGRAAMQTEIEADDAHKAALLEKIAAALGSAAYFDRERMAENLRQTVVHLVTKIVGEVGIAPDVLAARIRAAVEMLADHGEAKLLRVHPDDAPLLEGKLPPSMVAIADAQIERGGFFVESASTIIEDGPALWLEQMAAAIDRAPIPPLC